MDTKDDQRSEQEIAKRRDEVLKRMLNTPPKPHKAKERAPSKGRVRKGRSKR